MFKTISLRIIILTLIKTLGLPLKKIMWWPCGKISRSNILQHFAADLELLVYATVLHKRTMSVRIPPVNSPCSRTLRLCTFARHNESCESLGEKLGWDSNLIKSFKREHNVSFQPHYCGQRGGGRSWVESTRLFMQEGHGEAASPLSSASLCGVYWEWANKCDDVTQILIISAAGKKYINI